MITRLCLILLTLLPLVGCTVTEVGYSSGGSSFYYSDRVYPTRSYYPAPRVYHVERPNWYTHRTYYNNHHNFYSPVPPYERRCSNRIYPNRW
jgi:hypothetical protein